MYFAYGENEISYLKSKDEKLAEVIEKIGMIERETDSGDGYFQIAVLWHDLPKSGVYHGFCRKSS